MSTSVSSNYENPAHDGPMTVEAAVELARRAFALRKYEQAVEYYATALEMMTSQVGDNAPEAADLYFNYGKALLENAISQSAVLGKEQAEEDGPSGSNSKDTNAFLSFSGDAEDEEEAPDASREEPDTGGKAVNEDVENGDDGDEPEDDFNAAWEVLDLARALYDKQKEDDFEMKLKLADTYIALGDVSLETEKFDQAVVDYTAGLSLKTELLPLSSRQIAEAHYKLSMVLDLTPGRLSQSIDHAEKALESINARLADLRNGISGQIVPDEVELNPAAVGIKGKSKATDSSKSKLIREELVRNMTKSQMEAEIKELEELRDDLAIKVEELKTNPAELHVSAPELAAEALDQELNLPRASTSQPAVVNDLTSMVVKKKKKAPKVLDEADAEATDGQRIRSKRKAEDEDDESGKRAKTEET